MNLPPRNNTSFPKAVIESLKKIQLEKDNPLRYHQLLVKEYVVKNPNVRGLLVYHKMGSGKTITAVAIAEYFKNELDVVILASKSLHENFIDNVIKYRKLAGEPPNKLDKADVLRDYSFISTKTATTVKRLKAIKEPKLDIVESTTEALMDLDNTLVIVDEAHNLFNGLMSGSKSDMGIYDLIMNSKNIKIIFLTGSPVINTPAELMPCFNMLSRPLPSGTLMGQSWKDFHKYFIGRDRIKNKHKFQDRVFGLVSYYAPSEKERKESYPEQKSIQIEKIPMSMKQFAAYAGARDKEIQEASRGARRPRGAAGMSRPAGLSSSYRVRSRQISNFWFPGHAMHTERDEDGKRTTRPIISKLTKADWFNLSVLSPKIKKMLENLEKNFDPKSKDFGLGVVYSQFVRSGIQVIAGALKARGWGEITSMEDVLALSSTKTEKRQTASNGKRFASNNSVMRFANNGKSFAVITGDVDPERRSELIKIFNSDNNKRGNIISLLFISGAAAEGIDLKNVRHIHVTEPYWNASRIKQVLARAVRAGSHASLPAADRTVLPFIYLSDYPTSKSSSSRSKKAPEGPSAVEELMKKEPTTDLQLYMSAIKNQLLINSFLAAIREVSIDCVLHSTDKCRVCKPTDEQLFLPNLDKDMKLRSKCEPLQEKKIKAKEIIVILDNGEAKKYHYTTVTDTDDDDLPYTMVHIFEFRPDLNAHIEIGPDSPFYSDIITAIEKKEKL